MNHRTEKDSIGERQIPSDAYYGINAIRASENFNISGLKTDKTLIDCVVAIKKAAALVNMQIGMLPEDVGIAIVKAADDMLLGESELSSKLYDAIIVDPMQGGAGTSLNMNVNEVLANRAIEILGGEKGDYSIVHPNDHVNLSQSTNDVIPSAIKIATVKGFDEVIDELRKLFICLLDKSTEFMDVLKVGRTQMQDAVPISLGQEFFAYADSIRLGIELLEESKKVLFRLNMGGSAIGTGINVDPRYGEAIVPKINELLDSKFVQDDNLIFATQNVSCFVTVSGALKSVATSLSKIANDLRLMSSGPVSGIGEIKLPAVQAGSSIMPGKVNPVIPEIINQIAFKIIGNDMAICLAAEAGQLELNQFLPVISVSIGESLKIMKNALNTFRVNCVQGIEANKDVCWRNLNQSIAVVTALCPKLGYEKSSKVAKMAIEEGLTIKEIILRENILDEDSLNKIINPENLIKTFNIIKT